MRRTTTAVLLSVISILLVLPSLIAGNSEVPECCRRFGKHRCLMLLSDSATAKDQTNGVRSLSDRCPFIPSAGVLPTHSDGQPSRTGNMFYADLVSHPACHEQTKARYRTACTRTRLKRGPPFAA